MFITRVFAHTKEIISLRKDLREGRFNDPLGQHPTKEGLEKLIAKKELSALRSHLFLVFPGGSVIYLLIAWLLPIALGLEEDSIQSNYVSVIFGLFLFFIWAKYLFAISKLESYQDPIDRTPKSDWFLNFILTGLYIPVFYFAFSLKNLVLGDG